MKQHALSAIFPALPDDELQALAADIKAHGLHSAIVLYKGDVLDGWHRYQACEIAKVNPRTIDYNGSDPVAFVRSANWHRRHLSVPQRSLAQVQLSEWLSPGRPTLTGQNKPIKSAAEMASEAQVSVSSIKAAKTVDELGSAALKAAVKDGEIAIVKAATIAKLPKQEQAAAIKQPPAPKPKPAPAPEQFEPNLADELERADKEIRALQGLVESLKKSDLAKEVADWHMKFDQLEGRLHQCMATKSEAEKQAKYSTKLLGDIRSALGVKKNSEILPALKSGKGAK